MTQSALGADAEAAQIDHGRRIYEQGLLGSGAPVAAKDIAGGTLSGARAACVNCHRKSGFGMFEGANLVPPVTGPALFRNDQPLARATPNLAAGSRHQPHAFLTRPPYDDATLGRAISEGMSSAGSPLRPLMPRYRLAPDDMRALVAYLRQLSAEPSPGADRRHAEFATVITPDQSPARRDAMVATLRGCFKDRFPDGTADDWKWRLHVWELNGERDTWAAQLGAHLARQPVFALVSGLGGGDWEPVHRFCSTRALPCLYPNVDVPGAGLGEDRHSFYFSAGVLLEAGLAARHLEAVAAQLGIDRVVQVFAATGASRGTGARAAEALGEVLASATAGGKLAVELRPVGPERTALENAMRGVGVRDALVLWLSPEHVATLAGVPPPPTALTLLSGWMSNFERAPLPAAWRRHTVMTYPLEPPQRRHVRMTHNLRPWLERFGVAPGDEILQGNTLAACNLLSEGMLRLRGYFHREYLIDILEDYPVTMGNAPGAQAFPRFAAGLGQRFSSRGGYLVRFADDTSSELALVKDWSAP